MKAERDIDREVQAMECAGIAQRVAKTVPLGVIKGLTMECGMHAAFIDTPGVI